MISGVQHIYVVRIWREPSADGLEGWRASVSDAQTREKRFFASPRALAAYLGLEEDALETDALETGALEEEAPPESR